MSKKSEPATYAWNNGIFLALRTLMHFIAAVQYIYAIYYDFSYVHFPPHLQVAMGHAFGGKFKYLTVLDAVSVLLYIFIKSKYHFIYCKFRFFHRHCSLF